MLKNSQNEGNRAKDFNTFEPRCLRSMKRKDNKVEEKEKENVIQGNSTRQKFNANGKNDIVSKNILHIDDSETINKKEVNRLFRFYIER